MSDREFEPSASISATGHVSTADRPLGVAGNVDRSIAQAISGAPNLAEQRSERLLDELLKVQQYERQRLGQELHDAAGQLLTSLQFSIGRLRCVIEKSEQASIVDEISGIVGQIDQEIRSLAFLRYPAELGEKGVVRAIQVLASGFGRRTGIQTTFRSAGCDAPVDEETSLTLLRVAQEALTNVYRHSGASEAKVVMEERGRDLRLAVSDNGIGIDSTAAFERSGVGLTSMRDRVEVLGGRLTVRKLKIGTSISATVPLQSGVPAGIRTAR